MRSILAFALTVPVVLASLVLASCATDPYLTGSVAKRHKRTVAYRSVSERTETARTQTNSAQPSSAETSRAAATGADSNSDVTSKEDPRWQWCEQRHLDHQAGKAPAGAQDLEQKQEDDRTCAAVYSAQARRPQPGSEPLQPIDTGAILRAPATSR